MTPLANDPPVEAPKLTPSARSVFHCLAQHGAVTRPELGGRLGFSKPTMSAAIDELGRLGYVETVGLRQGSTGRKAAMYRLGSGAGHIIAVDAGSTYVRLRVCTLDGRGLYGGGYQLATDQRRLTPELGHVVGQAVTDVRQSAQMSWGPLRAIGVALPTKVPQQKDETTGSILKQNLIEHLTAVSDIPLLLENNVNCAAIAEGAFGVARDIDDFAYIQVGVKIGMGIVLRRELVRGRNGGAGEISYLPFPWGPGLHPREEELENYLGSEALMRRVRAEWPTGDTPPGDAPSLFRLAQEGHAAARAHIDRHAEDIARLVAACVAVLDPGLVVLGGGVGQNPLILPKVQQVVDDLAMPTRVEVSGLGVEATLMGIERLTQGQAYAALIGEGAG